MENMHSFTLRFNDEDWKQLNFLAEKLGLSKADIIRRGIWVSYREFIYNSHSISKEETLQLQEELAEYWHKKAFKGFTTVKELKSGNIIIDWGT